MDTEPAVDDYTRDQVREVDPLDPDSGKFVIETSLKLTEQQEARMSNHIFTRIDELKTEMGLGEDGSCVAGGWMEKREINERQYENDFAWRAALGGIFPESNFSLNVSKRYTRLISAKASDDLIGTDPFFAAMPTELGAPEDAKEAEWYVQDKVSGSNVKSALADGQRIALIRNEAVMKVIYKTDSTYYRGPATVAVGPFQYEVDGEAEPRRFGKGEPIMTPKGDYIYEMDDTFEDPNVQGLIRLQKEPVVSFRYSLEYARKPLLDQRNQEEGIDCRPIDYRDFLCSLACASIHESDMNAHLFTESFSRLKSLYGPFEVASTYLSNPPRSGEKQPKENQGEVENTSQVISQVNCADVYFRFNPTEGDEDDLGQECEIWAVVDVDNDRLIWYDYLYNYRARRPFGCIPGIEKVANRWYGVGVFEMMAHKQLYIDTQFNRVNYKSSKSASVRFRNRNAVAQWKAGLEVEFGGEDVLDIEDPRFSAQNPPLFAVNLTEIDEYAMKLIELMIQAGSTEIGIVGPDDGAMAGMDTTKLATGVKSLERTGNVLLKRTEQDHGVAIADILDMVTDVLLENMDRDELVYRPDTGALLQLNREEIRRMKKTIKLLLTRSRSTETIETARMVIQLCREYYEALNPEEQMLLRDEYVRQLKVLEVQDASARLKIVTQKEVDAWKVQQSQAATLPPKTSIATKYPDLERSEQVQVLKREGIEPAPDGEVAVSQARDAQLEVAKAGAIAKAKEDAKPDKPAASNNSNK